jgi:hypothetical protein
MSKYNMHLLVCGGTVCRLRHDSIVTQLRRNSNRVAWRISSGHYDGSIGFSEKDPS